MMEEVFILYYFFSPFRNKNTIINVTIIYYKKI